MFLYLGKKEKVIDPWPASLISSTDVISIEASPTTSPFTAKAICSRVSNVNLFYFAELSLAFLSS